MDILYLEPGAEAQLSPWAPSSAPAPLLVKMRTSSATWAAKMSSRSTHKVTLVRRISSKLLLLGVALMVDDYSDWNCYVSCVVCAAYRKTTIRQIQSNLHASSCIMSWASKARSGKLKRLRGTLHSLHHLHPLKAGTPPPHRLQTPRYQVLVPNASFLERQVLQ